MSKSTTESRQDWDLGQKARTSQRAALHEEFRKTVILSAMQPEDQNAEVRNRRLAHVGSNLAEALALQRESESSIITFKLPETAPAKAEMPTA